MTKANRSPLDYALEAADLGLRVVPLIPLGKRPWLKDWTTRASSDPVEIQAWDRQRPQSNWGIATGEDGLFLVDLDGAEAIEWFKSLGVPMGAIVRTPNAGQHIYYRVPIDSGIEIQTNAGKLHKGVDVRGVNGQGVCPGGVLPTGTYKGDLKAIADAPEASPELLALIPEKQTYTQTIPDLDEKVTEASAKERSSIQWIIGRLEALPEVWHEGAGWHAAVFESAAWLARMMRSPYYTLNEETCVQILLDHTPTYEGWAEDKIIEQWQSALKVTEGQYAEPPGADDETPTKVPLKRLQAALPELDSKNRPFLDLIITDAPADTEGARWDRRHQILLESFRAGLDMQHAYSAAVVSRAATALMSEHDGGLAIFKEAKKALREYRAEQSVSAPVTPIETGTRRIGRILLLDDAEREFMASPEARWWGDSYLEWITGSLKLANMPYHRLYQWMILSTVFGNVAYVPREGKKLGMNLWGVIIGESSTGKTEALEKAEAPIDAFFPSDDNPNIGSDATTEALHDTLILRDGKPSLQIVDEAHGLLAELNGGSRGFRGELVTRWTEYYEGKVRASLRSTKKDISGKSATTSFSLLLQGTSDKMTHAMTTSLWESGFLPRALFVIGENVEPSEEDLDVRLIDGDADYAYNGMPRQWATEWQGTQQRLEMRYSDFPIKMEFAPEALERLNRGMRTMRAELRRRPNQVALKPYMNRFPNQVLKMAALVALSEARIQAEMKDVVIALNAAEEFLGAAVEMARLTTDTDFAQKVDEVERLLQQNDGTVSMSLLYRHFPESAREVDVWVDQLIREARARKDASTPGGATLSIIGDRKGTAA